VAETYRKYLAQEYRYFKSNPSLSDDEVAQYAASAAQNRTFHDHQPIAWGGIVRFGKSGDLAAPGPDLYKELEASVGKDRAGDILRGGIPVYSPTPGGKAAWTFIKAGVPDTQYWPDMNGEPIRISLAPVPQTGPGETVDKLKADRLKAAAAVANSPNRLTVTGPGGVPAVGLEGR
jgi:hypothetical protein